MSIEIILQIAVLIVSVVVHEVSHGYAAFLLGDPTAKYAGRLSLNPIKHLDLWGSFVIPFLLVISGAGIVLGWAKPVPYNPYNLKNQKWGPAIVGIAGPMSNVILVLFSGLAMRGLYLTGSFGSIWFDFLTMVAFINIVLLVFNMLPIPPLDGSKLLFSILPISEQTKATLEQYGFVILLAFLFLFSHTISVLVEFVREIFFKYIVFA